MQRRTLIHSSLAALAMLVPAPCQDTPGQTPPQGSQRERMWPAPTAEDWAKPVLIEFERSWEDAVAVSRETGKPILVCVNMDGEVASEHYAGIRYRQPEIAKLYEPYVCVIASVYRHNHRDHDEHGHRIPCPRFGSVTCGEHIAIEPMLFEKFMDGQRIAPRHIMVELDGSESYDVFYAFDTQSVFDAIEGGIANRTTKPEPIVRGDRSLVERVASRALEDRRAVEQAYAEGDRTLREALLAAATQNPDAAPTDLLRLAVFGLDEDLAARARDALAKVDDAGAAELIAEALRVPMAGEQREALLARLSALGDKSPQAKALAVVHRGLAARSDAVDAETWTRDMKGGASYRAPDAGQVADALERAAAASADEPADAESRLAVAEGSLALAIGPEASAALANDPRTAGKFTALLFEDARRAALEAQALGGETWRIEVVLALIAQALGESERAFGHAEKAVPGIPAGTTDWKAIRTLALFAEGRHRQIVAAARAREEWPGTWLTDASAAYSVLAEHPLGTDVQVASHYDLLAHLGARGRASRVLDEGLRRFPESATLHDCLRQRTLRERGPDGLVETYDAWLAEPEATAQLRWFAGYAGIVAAEFHRRRNRTEDAGKAYARALALFDEVAEGLPESRDSADHFAALILGAQARLALEAADVDACLASLRASFARRPMSAASLDGLNLSPMDTARMLRGRLVAEERSELLQTLDAETAKLRALDPSLLELPAYERGGSGGGAGQGRRGR
ncbi:MAG: hypothetical protein ACO4CZ_06470 [Planctomycetota bacterium]